MSTDSDDATSSDDDGCASSDDDGCASSDDDGCACPSQGGSVSSQDSLVAKFAKQAMTIARLRRLIAKKNQRLRSVKAAEKVRLTQRNTNGTIAVGGAAAGSAAAAADGRPPPPAGLRGSPHPRAASCR